MIRCTVALVASDAGEYFRAGAFTVDVHRAVDEVRQYVKEHDAQRQNPGDSGAYKSGRRHG
ncbi:hypothetical protein ACQP1G_18085 [Nocardia sp. CA-107356]|uniref:hypothetical protein n=1 Tax=Nocardia sp. CA-107356 TaxID=3239972 RepID=UPI003D9359E1